MKAWEENIRKVVPYIPGEQPQVKDIIKLNTNENPYPPSPGVKKAHEEMEVSRFALYPDPAAKELVTALESYHGLDAGQVFVGVGSDDVLAMCFMTFFNGEKPILFPDITYSFYPVWADLYGVKYENPALDENFRIRKEDYFKENGGAVLSTTFDKYCYVNVRHLPRFFDYSTELSYSKTERVTNTDDIQHPAIREAMKMLNMQEIRLTYEADLPARSGLGTSSSFAVGMLNAFYALKGKYADKRKLADDAIYLERVLCNESGGVQDQIAAAFGGLNRINFNADGYEVNPVIISPERKTQLNNNLMLFFTGFSRFSSDIQQTTEKALVDKQKQLLEMLSLVDDAEKVLTSKTDLNEFGRLLDYTWKLKRGISNRISTDSIDGLYAKGMAAGALGGKLLGAGGGGFLLFYVEPDKQEAVHKAMEELLYVPFEFENSGTRVIHYTPETYEKR